jgi:uncharacterized protein involved in response to NO
MEPTPPMPASRRLGYAATAHRPAPRGWPLLIEGLLRTHNQRYLPLPGIVLLLACANLAFHLAVLGVLDIAPMRALHAGLALVVMLECLVAVRVIPGFTISALPGVTLRRSRRLESAMLASSAVALALWVLAPPGPVPAAACAAAAALHALCLRQWQPWRAWVRPMLGVLHLAYAWLPIGFVLLALAQLGVLGPSAGVHALAVGATGGLIIGMMTRTARGHTGRAQRASGLEVAAYGLLAGAAVLRVALPLLVPRHQPLVLAVAAAAWSAAFGLCLYVIAPWLLTTRLDGKDG